MSAARTDRQPTNEELQALLDACQTAGPGTCWNERVLALQEALDARHTWRDNVDERDLALACRRYLRFAGARV